MGFTIPWWVYVVLGAMVMLTVLLPIFVIVCAWAGWPRQRESELERYVDLLVEENKRLEAQLAGQDEADDEQTESNLT